MQLADIPQKIDFCRSTRAFLSLSDAKAETQEGGIRSMNSAEKNVQVEGFGMFLEDHEANLSVSKNVSQSLTVDHFSHFG